MQASISGIESTTFFYLRSECLTIMIYLKIEFFARFQTKALRQRKLPCAAYLFLPVPLVENIHMYRSMLVRQGVSTLLNIEIPNSRKLMTEL